MYRRILVTLALASTAAFAQSSSDRHYDLQHIDVTFVDKSADPCDNFYQYACGKVLAKEPIPADQSTWGSAGRLFMWNQQVLHGILDKYSTDTASRTPNEQKIGDYYHSCLVQAESGADDSAALKPLLDKIAAVKDKRGLALVKAEIDRNAGSVWNGDDNQTNAPMFGFGPSADFNDTTRVVGGVDQGGLGMPNRDFYLNDDEDSRKLRDVYTQYVASLLVLNGDSADAAKKEATTILALETKLAKAQRDNVTRRDPNKANNRYDYAGLKKLTPDFDWDAYMKALDAPVQPLYEVTSPDFMQALNTQIREQDLATWKLYFRAYLLGRTANVLGNKWRDARFVLNSALMGQKKQPTAWLRCSHAVDAQLGEALGQVYVAQVFPADSKARALQMVKGIEAAMGRDIDAVTWMQPATKKEAHEKLAALVEKIGYPDKWIDYSTYRVTRDSYVENYMRGVQFELHRQLSQMGKPLDKTLWQMTPPTLDAYEDAQSNTINFPAGILQPPFFDPTLDDVINYGSEGAVIGHEMTHDFDDQGRKFDLKGNLRDWWTPQDAKEYDARGECIAKEYTGAVPGISGVTQNGKLTQGEDTADNGGLYLALSALKDDLKQHGKTLDDKDANGLTNLQRFFIAYGNSWCEEYRPELARTLVLSNPHSLPVLRVNNTVANMPEFSTAFNCKPGQKEVHETRCRVW